MTLTRIALILAIVWALVEILPPLYLRYSPRERLLRRLASTTKLYGPDSSEAHAVRIELARLIGN